MLRCLNVDIVFLQETHITSMREAKTFMKNFWSGKHFWSFGGNNARGVGILLAKDLDYELLHTTHDLDGRTVVVDIKTGENKFRLINIYAPNNHRERKQFIKDLDLFLINNFDYIVGGDWNFIEDRELDKRGGNSDNGLQGKVELQKLKDDFLLKDAHRSRYLDRRVYTWFDIAKGVSCRLDRFYLSEHMTCWIDEIKYVSCSVSDHQFVVMKFKDIDNSTGRFGPGYWKHNVSVYDKPEFILELTDLWEKKLSLDPFSDDFWWENCKVQFKKLIIKHSRKLADLNRKHIFDLEKHGQYFLECINNTNDPHEKDTYKTCLNQIKGELNDILTDRFNGALLRSKVQILEQGEKPTRYFLQLEKKVAKSKMITEVRANGNQYFDSDDIIREVRGFWESIFTSGQTDDDAVDFFLLDAGLPRVPPDLVESCEGPLSVREAQAAINDMKNGKSPGSDGLGCEFYKKFFYLFGEKYVAMINLCFQSGQLTESQRLSLITLLCKDRDEHYLPINWRPISLMNVDCKIVSKSICNRLKKVLPYIICIDQTCSVEGRSISDNIHLLRNIFDYVNSKNIGCLWVNFDQFKAFDRVEHRWLMRVLEAFGFGPDFIQWVRVLYANLKSSVIVNGHISLEFNFSRGVRQGCPLSPLLYVLCIEPFSNRIRDNPDIRGLPIPGSPRESKVTQYADDNTMTLVDIESAAVCFDLFELYERASGSELNRGKTKGIWLGKFKDRGDTPFGIEWVPQKKLLGIVFGYGDLREANWGRILNGFKLVLQENMYRSTSLYGRALVANSLAVSKIVFAAQHTIISKVHLEQFERMYFEFIWNRDKKKDKFAEFVGRDTLIAPAKYGGINAVSIKTKCEALLIKHILRIIQYSYSDYQPQWTYFANYWVGFSLREYNEEFSSNSIPKCFDFRPHFYFRAYRVFLSYVKKFPINSPNDFVKPVKQIYFELLTHVAQRPRVSVITIYPNLCHINFRTLWRACRTDFLDPELKNLRFKVAHQVIALNANLEYRSKGKITDNNFNCVLCWPFQNTPETMEHFFLYCYQISKIWEWVTPKLLGLCNHRLKICKDEILYCQFPENMPAVSREILIYIVSLVMYSAWIHRHAIKHCGRSSREKNAVFELFKAKLKFRIRADFVRLNQCQFEDYWAKNEILCKVVNNGSRVEFLF